MTVTTLPTPKRFCAKPKPGSYVHAIYTTIEAYNGVATCAEVRELLSAAGGPEFATFKETHRHVTTIAGNLGYVRGDTCKSGLRAPATDEEYGRAVYRLATPEEYAEHRKHKNDQQRARQAKKDKELARQQRAEERAEERRLEKEQLNRVDSARARVLAGSTTSTQDVPQALVTPTPTPPPTPTLTRTDLILVTGTACFFSVAIYAVLEKLL